MAEKKAKSKLLSLYPERELKFGELNVSVRALPGIKAADLIEHFSNAADVFRKSTWTALETDAWPRIRDLIAPCVTFDDPDVGLDDLPLGPLGQVVDAVRSLTLDSVGDPGNPLALPQAVGRIYGLVLGESKAEPTESGTGSQK